MELTCTRCHQTIQEGICFCPACGLPQLVYTGEGLPENVSPEDWGTDVRDAGTVDWKSALPLALMMAIPAGVLSSSISPLGFLGMLWTATSGAWVVLLYSRKQQPVWLTLGAGARIGLVTGLLAGWIAFAVSGSVLYVERYAMHQGNQIDAEWKQRVDMSQQLTQQWTGSSAVNTGQAQSVRAQVRAFMLSPEGHAGIESFGFACNSLFLLLFATGGGAFGARVLLRRRGRGV
jgi:hypothetical protein